MIKYLKYIVLVFGSIGILVGSFFYYQNRVDIHTAWEYDDIIDYEYLQRTCVRAQKNYIYPCLKNRFGEYLQKVSFTGVNIGLKMVFTVMDEDKIKQEKYKTQNEISVIYGLNYLEINNMAMDNAYKRYFGIKNLYGGFLTTLEKFYTKSHQFSENLIIGLKSREGINSIQDVFVRESARKRFEQLSNEYYEIKKTSQEFIEAEVAKLRK